MKHTLATRLFSVLLPASLLLALPDGSRAQTYTNGQPYIRNNIPPKPGGFPIPMSFGAFSGDSVVAAVYDDVIAKNSDGTPVLKANGQLTPKARTFDERLAAQSGTFPPPAPTSQQTVIRFIHGSLAKSVTEDQQNQIMAAAGDTKIVTIQEAWGGVGEEDIWDNTTTKVWPGHVLYRVATRLTPTKNPNAGDTATTTFVVDDAKKLFNPVIKAPDTIQTALDRENGGPLAYYLTIYKVQTGVPNWNQAEYVKLTAIDLATNTITVSRAQFGTTARPYSTAGSANGNEVRVVAPMKFWDGQWQLNFSFACPKNSAGQSAAIWYARLIQDKVFSAYNPSRTNGAGADGVEHDVARWTWGNTRPGQNMDCNNDKIEDFGFIDGINSFGLGGQAYLQELRRLLPNHIIQMDSTNPATGQRGYKYPNGIQMECFPNANQFQQFSTAFQHIRSWHLLGEQPSNISYPFTKTPTTVFANVYTNDLSGNATVKTDWRFRVGLASATLLKMPHPFSSITGLDFDPDYPLDTSGATSTSSAFKGTFNWDEYHGGDLNQGSWLGIAMGPLVQDFSDLDFTTNLTSTGTWYWSVDTAAGYTANTTVSGNTFTANVTGFTSDFKDEEAKARYFRVQLKTTASVPLAVGSYYTLQFGAQGRDTWTETSGNSTWSSVPGFIAIRGIDPDYDPDGTKTNPTGVLVTNNPNFTSFNISVMAGEDPNHPGTPYALMPAFGVSEQVGTTSIRNIKLYKGSAEHYARKYQNGLILLNMSANDWIVPIDSAGKLTLKNSNNVTFSWDGGKASTFAEYRHLNGTQCRTEIREDGSQISVNDGSVVGTTILVPRHDAVFLRQSAGD